MKLRILVWTCTVACSCMITLLVTEWWQKARATVELTRIEIRSPGKPTDKLVVGEDLAQKTQEHPYFTSLHEESTFEAIDKALDEGRQKTNRAKRTSGHIEGLITLLGTQSAALSLEKRRAQFLAAFVSKAEESSFFEDVAKVTLDDYEAQLPTKYSAHPPGSEQLSVNLENATYRLAQEDEDDVAKRIQSQSKDINAYTIARREAHRTNLWRRLFAYYEPEILLSFFSTCKERTERWISKAETIMSELTTKIEQTRQQHMYVSVLVANSGDTALPIQSIAVLKLQVPNLNKSGSQSVSIRLGAENEPSAMTIVEKGKPQLIALMSTKPLAKIIEENHDLLGGDQWAPGSSMTNSRFLQLWQAKTAGLEASVRLAQATLDPRNASLAESVRHAISLSNDQVVYEQLEK